MGKTIKKNQARKTFVGVMGGRYVVRGKTFAVQAANSATIAADMVERGYRDGASARWNGGEYALRVDYFGDHSLERIA